MGYPYMFPKEFPQTNSSNAEKRVFNYFKDNAPDNWYVIHSFRIKEHSKVVFGESDFVVIAPPYGIFVLEIKGGGVSFDGQLWHFEGKDSSGTKTRGPFEQAREGMFEIERILKEKLGPEYNRSRIRYHYGVIFTDQSGFPAEKMTEDESWRLMQKHDKYDGNYCKFIIDLYSNFKTELHELEKHQPASLSDEAAKTIVNTLKPKMETLAPVLSFIESTEDDIERYTDEQMICIEDIKANERVVVLGGAGTGKTVLAIKDANENSDDYDSVGFFCFSNKLAREIKKRIKNEKVKVYSFHGFLKEICEGFYDGSDEDEKGFYNKTLPSIAKDIINEKDIRFDRIIIDEFQDLCTNEFLDVLDAALTGGLFDGNFAFYGDFSHQAIFNKDSDLKNLANRTYFYKKMLSINCRNTKYIGNEIINITGYNEQKYLLNIDGQKVDYYSWKDEEEEFSKLCEILNDLERKEIPSSSIVILSPRKHEGSKINDSIVGKKDPHYMVIGKHGDNPNKYKAVFSTIQAFKGLESSIIIVTDITDYNDPQLMYVALSRAKSKLYVLESESAKKQRIANIQRRA